MRKNVEHPDWYTNVDGIECKDINGHLNYNLGCAVKYIWRAGAKEDIVLDYEKAIQYLKFEIERVEKLWFFIHRNNPISDELIKKLLDSKMELYKKYIVLCIIKANNLFGKKKYIKTLLGIIFSVSMEIGELRIKKL